MRGPKHLLSGEESEKRIKQKRIKIESYGRREKKSKKRIRKPKINKRNPVAKALRTPKFRSRVELDRKKESKSTGKYLDEE